MNTKEREKNKECQGRKDCKEWHFWALLTLLTLRVRSYNTHVFIVLSASLHSLWGTRARARVKTYMS